MDWETTELVGDMDALTPGGIRPGQRRSLERMLNLFGVRDHEDGSLVLAQDGWRAAEAIIERLRAAGYLLSRRVDSAGGVTVETVLVGHLDHRQPVAPLLRLATRFRAAAVSLRARRVADPLDARWAHGTRPRQAELVLSLAPGLPVVLRTWSNLPGRHAYLAATALHPTVFADVGAPPEVLAAQSLVRALGLRSSEVVPLTIGDWWRCSRLGRGVNVEDRNGHAVARGFTREDLDDLRAYVDGPRRGHDPEDRDFEALRSACAAGDEGALDAPLFLSRTGGGLSCGVYQRWMTAARHLAALRLFWPDPDALARPAQGRPATSPRR